MTPTVDQAIALHRAGRLADAEHCYRDILETYPDALAARNGLGVVLLQTNRAEDAAPYFAKVIESHPDDVEARNNLGAAALQCGRLEDARESFEKALDLAPNHGQARANLGVVLYKLNDLEGSVDAFEAVIAAGNSNADTYYNHSQTLRALGRFDEAEAAARRAIDRAPDRVDAHVGLGITQAAKGDRAAAEASYRTALNTNPRAAEAHHNLAQILLQSGRLAEGWEAFEWRWHTPDFRGAGPFRDLPLWHGAPLAEGTLLVWTEQGVGDQILYSSMVHDLEGRAPSLMVACTERLVPVFTRSFPFADVVSQTTLKAEPALLESVTAQIPSGSLGQFLRPSLESFPDRTAFLGADPDKVSVLKAKYQDQFGDSVRIGLSWRSGNPRFGAAKSIMLADLKPVFAHSNITFVDLQYGNTDDERASFSREHGFEIHRDPVIDAKADLDGFAAQVAAMDLVITASNTAAHIAGALAVPCWTLLPAGPGLLWYWFLDRGDSPWYPSLRLFRQGSPGNWTAVAQQVSEALSGFIPAYPGAS
jgi:tetratricopeptide (TPR) repeat protein